MLTELVSCFLLSDGWLMPCVPHRSKRISIAHSVSLDDNGYVHWDHIVVVFRNRDFLDEAKYQPVIMLQSQCFFQTMFTFIAQLKYIQQMFNKTEMSVSPWRTRQAVHLLCVHFLHHLTFLHHVCKNLPHSVLLPLFWNQSCNNKSRSKLIDWGGGGLCSSFSNVKNYLFDLISFGFWTLCWSKQAFSGRHFGVWVIVPFFTYF